MMKGFWERFSDFLRNSKKVFNADEKLLDMQIIEFPAFFSFSSLHFSTGSKKAILLRKCFRVMLFYDSHLEIMRKSALTFHFL